MATHTSLVLRAGDKPPQVEAYSFGRSGIAAVRWDDLTIQSTDPAQLVLLAEAATDAARQLSACLANELVNELADSPADVGQLA